MGETLKKCCKNCEYHDNFTWACSCAVSDQRGDFTDDEFVCEGWKKRKEGET